VTKDPDFRTLVGDESDREELDRLRRVHELLVAAGPPPELSPAVAEAPRVGESKLLDFRRRRPTTALALAAALAVVALLVGYAVADMRTGFSSSGPPIPMHGIGRLAAAHADIEVGRHDSGGNYPLQMIVRGLPRLPKGGWYELLLSKNGKPTLSCGSFAVDGKNETIMLSVPYDLGDRPKLFNGWVVTRHLPKNAVAPVVMTA
jgi:hypothetical protein